VFYSGTEHCKINGEEKNTHPLPFSVLKILEKNEGVSSFAAMNKQNLKQSASMATTNHQTSNVWQKYFKYLVIRNLPNSLQNILKLKSQKLPINFLANLVLIYLYFLWAVLSFGVWDILVAEQPCSVEWHIAI
jgi:hypothetical protein